MSILLGLLASLVAPSLAHHCRQMGLAEYQQVGSLTFPEKSIVFRPTKVADALKSLCQDMCWWRLVQPDPGFQLPKPSLALQLYEKNRHKCQADGSASKARYIDPVSTLQLDDGLSAVHDVYSDEKESRLVESRCFGASGFLLIPRVHKNNMRDEKGVEIHCDDKEVVENEFTGNYSIPFNLKNSIGQTLIRLDRKRLQNDVSCAQ